MDTTIPKAANLTPSRASKQATLNEAHLYLPQRGDVWHEHFGVICLVIWSNGAHVEYLCRRVHGRDLRDGWTWDTRLPPCRSTIEQFAKWLSYGSIRGTWCDVVPNATKHTWAMDEALEARVRREQMRKEQMR